MREEQGTRWLWLKLAVVALAAGGATFFALRGDSEWKQSDAPETAVPFICVKDNHAFQVTPAGFEKMTEAGDAQSPADPSGRGEGLLTLRCPKCAQMTAVRGQACQNDGTIFPARLLDGRAGRCPKCGWSFYR